jgi:hypothetical protein
VQLHSSVSFLRLTTGPCRKGSRQASEFWIMPLRLTEARREFDWDGRLLYSTGGPYRYTHL